LSTQPPISPRLMFERLNLGRACEAAIAEVNPQIAPAQISGWDFDRHDENILEFFASWGLVRFSVFVATFPLFHGTPGEEKTTIVVQLMRLAPRAMADAIGRIARNAAQEHLSHLTGRLQAVEGRVTAIESAANERDEREHPLYAPSNEPRHWIRRVRDAWNGIRRVQ
jgi:hypothetical protein